MLFRIRKKSLHGPANAGKVSEFKVLGLNKWRKTEGASQGSHGPFQKCLAMGLSFLDALIMIFILLLLLLLAHSNKALESIGG